MWKNIKRCSYSAEDKHQRENQFMQWMHYRQYKEQTVGHKSKLSAFVLSLLRDNDDLLKVTQVHVQDMYGCIHVLIKTNQAWVIIQFEMYTCMTWNSTEALKSKATQNSKPYTFIHSTSTGYCCHKNTFCYFLFHSIFQNLKLSSF